MKKTVISFVFIVGCISVLVSQNPIGNTGFESLNYLYSISGKYTLAGQHGRGYWMPIRQVAGDYPALWGEDLLFYAGDGTSTMAQWRALVVQDAREHWVQGALITIMYHACPPTQAEPCGWTGGVLSTLSDAQWAELITDGTTLNNNWKARLDNIYPYLKALNDAGVEVLFRLFHEMNQGAFWWGGRPGANGTVKLYQITHDYLVNTKGLTNLIWVWNLQDFSTLATDLTNYDPGSNYWDVLALDVYGSDGTRYTTNKYNLIKNKAAGKPIAIGECDVLPSVTVLQAQPGWTYFMGWADLTQSSNSNSTIQTIYNASNVLTLSETERAPAQTNQDPLMICNFDDVFPYLSTWGNLTLDFAQAPAGSPASGETGMLSVPAGNPSDGCLMIQMPVTFDPRNYVGISFLVQSSVNNISFVTKLEQFNVDNSIAQIQDWNTNPKYTGNGDWQEVDIPFTVILNALQNKLSANPSFPATAYNIIEICPAPYQYLPAFTLNMDDIRFRTSWTDETTGIQSTKNSDAIVIFAANGTISAKTGDGAPVLLKVYSPTGQEVANGMNQIQMGTKGVYIVKASTPNESKISKVVVQ